MAYSRRPRRKPGPCGFVRIQPNRKPTFQTRSPDWLPLVPWPPPVQTCSSWPPSTGPACERTVGAQKNRTRKRKPVIFLLNEKSPRSISTQDRGFRMQKRYRKSARKATHFYQGDRKLEKRGDQLQGLAPDKYETSSVQALPLTLTFPGAKFLGSRAKVC